MFKSSESFTVGVEFEIQIINKDGYDLLGVASDILKQLDVHAFNNKIKPEITQSMLEINSGIYHSPAILLIELRELIDYLAHQARDLNVCFAGGGTHPFQMWNERKIYPNDIYKDTASKYGYLAKMLTVFGLHIHVGCANGNDAIYLMNALAEYVPHLIALSASSPFCQNEDTGFDSARTNVINSFHLSGLAPVTGNWEEFSGYMEKMRELKIVEKVDNFYWDIRPKANFGTIEIRVCDAPLSIDKVVMLAAYVQTLSHYLLIEKPYQAVEYDKYQLHKHNRFQASRYGFSGMNVNLRTHTPQPLRESILETCILLENHAIALKNDEFISEVINAALHNQNDAAWLRELKQKGLSFQEIVKRQSMRLMNPVAEKNYASSLQSS